MKEADYPNALQVLVHCDWVCGAVFLLEEVPILLVGAKEPVPPQEGAGIVPREVAVMEVVKPSTLGGGRRGGSYLRLGQYHS